VHFSGNFVAKVRENETIMPGIISGMNLCPRNMGVERNYNSETASLREENFKKNIRAHKRKSNMEN